MASDASRAASPLATLGYYLTLLYVVLLVGRIPEIAQYFIGSSLYMVMGLTMLMLPLTLMTGTIVLVGSTRIGLIWFAFHLWVMLTLPFSGYRAGSLDTFTAMMKYFPGVFFVGGFLARNVDSLRKGIWSLAWAATVGLAWVQYTGVSEDEDRFVSVGTFGNSNLLAIYVLMMMPIWGFIVANPRYRWPTRLAFLAILALGFNSVLKTGSRSGLMTLMLFGLLFFLSLGIANKFKFVVVAVAVTMLSLSVMPESLKSRLSTVFTSESKDAYSAEAQGSSEQRYALLIESIETTLKHPLVGTGLGVYAAVNAKEKEHDGKKALWQVTHNAYTQISAETGIPGFLLYISALFLAIKEAWKIKRATQGRPEMRELNMIVTALLFSYVAFCFNACFTSMATEFSLYTLVGFSIASGLVYRDLIQRQASAGAKAAPAAARSAQTETAPAAPNHSAQTGDQPAAVAPAVSGYDDAPWRRNPRKFPPPPGTPSR